MLIHVVPAPYPPPPVEKPLMVELTALLEQLPEGDRIIALKFCRSLVKARRRQQEGEAR